MKWIMQEISQHTTEDIKYIVLEIVTFLYEPMQLH